MDAVVVGVHERITDFFLLLVSSSFVRLGWGGMGCGWWLDVWLCAFKNGELKRVR